MRLCEVPFLTPDEQADKDLLASLSQQIDRLALERDIALAGYRVEQERRVQLEAQLKEARRGS